MGSVQEVQLALNITKSEDFVADVAATAATRRGEGEYALISAAQFKWAFVMGLKEPPKTAMRLRALDSSSDASAIVLPRSCR